MKKLLIFLALVLFFSVDIAIMLSPAIIMATCFGLSLTMFLILLIPCSVIGFLIGFLILEKVMDTGIFDKLLNLN